MKKIGLKVIVIALLICLLPLSVFATTSKLKPQTGVGTVQIDPNIQQIDPGVGINLPKLVSYSATAVPSALASAGNVNIQVTIMNPKEEALKEMSFAKLSTEGPISIGDEITKISAKSSAKYIIKDVPIEFNELGTDVKLVAFYRVSGSNDVVNDEFTVYVDKASSLPNVKITSYINPVSVTAGDQVMVDYYIENNSVDKIVMSEIADRILSENKVVEGNIPAGGHATISATATINEPISSVATLMYTYQGAGYTESAAPVVIAVATPAAEPTATPTPTAEPTATPTVELTTEPMVEPTKAGEVVETSATKENKNTKGGLFQVLMIILLILVLISVITLIIVIGKKNKTTIAQSSTGEKPITTEPEGKNE